MRESTCWQKSLIATPGAAVSTSGTIPATIPGRVFDAGLTRRLTGKSSTTSEPSAHQPRISNAHAAVMTEDRGMFHSCATPCTRRSTAGSNGTGADRQFGSRSAGVSDALWFGADSAGRLWVQ